ncbi:COQ9 family protein [Ponticoccus alexandrii]|uniref:COQ9 family protein n=1 Tax=Ponticoccus alexandrii TaxID=1943633 RepID=A0ABX7FBH7_9RHOB|nr:COQ9 family protein [Ponticoccus alexandrii]ETA51095.1 COQ9 family ubiquinone biosynthesis protein [Rhodobacteraceae bacterium PD-2]QRF67911.1 COQ9 family protein [Ponticoccus alexandrii]
MQDSTDRLLDAILPHVPFDGWTETAFRAALAEAGIDPVVGRGLVPRGALDLAAAYHRRGDAAMARALASADFEGMRFRDKVAHAVRLRLEQAGDREVVRRGTTLFSLPHHAPEGARLLWGTADAIWTALGDTSNDVNWYTKRATLSGVYGATVLYWLGDESPDHVDTWAFLDRRIEDVMQIEKAKAQVRENRVLGTLLAGPLKLMERIRPPASQRRDDLPGGRPAS